MKTITEITRQKPTPPQIRLAAYCRVSSDSSDQLHSFAAQIKYYSEYCKRHPEYKFVDIYADATDIIGLKQNPTNGRRFSPIFHLSGIFRYKTRKCYF